jgi:MFS family permease
MGTGGVLPNLTRFGVSVLGLTERDSFQLILPALLGTIVAAVPAGYAADRVGKKPRLAAGPLAYSIVALVASEVETCRRPSWRWASSAWQIVRTTLSWCSTIWCRRSVPPR